MFDEFLKDCPMNDEIKPSKKRVKKNIAALRSLIETEESTMTKRKFRLKPLIIAVAVIAGLSVITGAVSIIRQGGFLFDKGHMDGVDFFVMITENAGEAPKTIEKLCYDNNLPPKYKPYSEDDTPYNGQVWMTYYDSEAGSMLQIGQSTKGTFTEPFLREDICTPVEIKGNNGFTIVHTDERPDRVIVNNTVIWDCGEYIHMVCGDNISMEELMSIIDGMTEKQENPGE